MTSTQAGDFAASDTSANAVESFESTGPMVFASLCRVTVGDRALSERLLADTYVELQRSSIRHPDRKWLLTTAHRLYAEQSPATTRGRSGSAALETGWSKDAWRGSEPDALAQLTPQERIALNLRLLEGFPLADVGRSLGVDATEVTRLITHGQSMLDQVGMADSVREVLQHGEVWLDDDARDRVRAVLTAEQKSRSPMSTPDSDDVPIRSRIRRSHVLGAAGALVALVALIVWLSSSPHENGDPVHFNVPNSNDVSISIATTTEPVTAPSIQSAQPIAAGDTRFRVEPGSLAESATVLASSVGDLTDVQPDAIIRYDNGKLGISWHGPCNRPAATVQISVFTDAIGLRLTTGSFPVTACDGMPNRWTAVVQPQVRLPDLPVVPLVDDAPDMSFTGFSVGHPSEDNRAVTADSSAGYTSALIDQGNQAWVYLEGCQNIQAIPYQSPVGVVFEVRNPAADPVYCVAPDPTQRLRGPGDSQFPQPKPAPGQAPIDCRGPFQSATDVPDERPFTAQFHDGDWSTWDGCLVRSDVIYSRSLASDCGWADARTITFAPTIGDRIVAVGVSQTYLRDPHGVVPDNTPISSILPALPDGARDSGFRFGTDELWISDADPRAIYVKSGETVEQWPRIDVQPTCS